MLQGLLIAGEPRHLLRVEWSSPAQVPFEPAPRPVDSSEVDLWLVVPAGDSAHYITTGLPGQFAAVAAVDGGGTYRLSGTVAGRDVTAQVHVPGALVVVQPAEDTLRLPIGADFPPVLFAWRAESATSYQALLAYNDGTTSTAYVLRGRNLLDIAPDTAGVLRIFAPAPVEPDTARLVILGYDPTVTAFFSSTTKGNVREAFGLFGAASKIEKVIVWE